MPEHTRSPVCIARSQLCTSELESVPAQKHKSHRYFQRFRYTYIYFSVLFWYLNEIDDSGWINYDNVKSSQLRCIQGNSLEIITFVSVFFVSSRRSKWSKIWRNTQQLFLWCKFQLCDQRWINAVSPSGCTIAVAFLCVLHSKVYNCEGDKWFHLWKLILHQRPANRARFSRRAWADGEQRKKDTHTSMCITLRIAILTIYRRNKRPSKQMGPR